MIDKLDKKILEILTSVVKRWIKKKKYAQHKYDFFIMLMGWEIAVWIAHIIVSFIKHKSLSNGIVNGFILVAVVFMEGFKLKQLQEIKDEYDWIWERRKDPRVYNLMKETCQHIVEWHAHFRKVAIVFFIVATALLAPFAPLMSLVYIGFIVQVYKECVFDFDEPDKKEKEKKEALTEVAAKAWNSLVNGLSPKGVN